ncbi:MAG: hypothetical protein Q4B36_06060 [Tissierellia bacterium]|nr:hypothetical protein [Tissierellia bacterium]
MDYYKKRKVQIFCLFVLFVIGTILQIVGHKGEGYSYLGIQFISLVILLLVLYLYNKRQK